MIIAIYLTLLILSLYFKKSNKLFWVILIFMWGVSSFCYGIADEMVYQSRYSNSDLWESYTEFGFKLLILICNKLGLSFVAFRAVVASIELLLIGCTVKKYAKYPNLVMLLYFLCPFPLNVAQMRSALASAVMIFGFKYIIEENKKKVWKFGLNDIKFMICILIATTIHTSGFIWVLLLVAKKFNRRMNILIMLVFNLLIYFVINPVTLVKLASMFGAGARISSYLSAEYQSTEWRHIGPIVYVIFVAGITILACLYIQKSRAQAESVSESKQMQIELCIKMNIILMCILGIILRYTSEVIRLQEGIAILNYMFLTNAIEDKKFKVNRLSASNLIILGLVGIYILVYVWFEILEYLTASVWLPFWFNNYLFHF